MIRPATAHPDTRRALRRYEAGLLAGWRDACPVFLALSRDHAQRVSEYKAALDRALRSPRWWELEEAAS
jgi:hypothetical protein